MSIVIPAWRSDSSVGEAIVSAVVQRPEPFEVIVVDSGPESQTAIINQYAARYPIVNRVWMPPQGISAARNFGVRAAQGDIVVFLDADDALCSSYMQEMTRLAESGPAKALGASLTYKVAGVEDKTIGYIECVPNEYKELAPGEHPMVFPSGFWVPREIALRVGRFDENLRTGEDGAPILRMMREAGFVANVEDPGEKRHQPGWTHG